MSLSRSRLRVGPAEIYRVFLENGTVRSFHLTLLLRSLDGYTAYLNNATIQSRSRFYAAAFFVTLHAREQVVLE